MRAGFLAGQPHQHELGQSPGMQRLPHLIDTERRDAGTMIDPRNNDLLMGQSRQHATNVAASSIEHLRQTFLGKATGFMNALFKNGVEDPRVQIILRRWKG
ncbi:hypothetical protein D3C85_1494810 [compost metagenome]